MDNTSSSELATSVANMIAAFNFNPRNRRTPFDSPLKRRLSYDSTDTPDKKAKLDSSLDVSWISSPREHRRIRAELIEARSVISSLENRIHHMHGIRKELQIMYDNEIKSFQQQHERDVKSVTELEAQMLSIRKREKEVNDELDLIKSKVGTAKIDYESKIEDLEQTVNKHNSELKVFKSEEENEISKLNNRIEELEMLVAAATDDAQAQKKLVSVLEKRISELSAVEREMEIKDQALLKAQLKIKDLKYTLEGYGEWQIQSKIQQQKLTQFPELERETQRLRNETKNLREEVRNKLILEEQVYDLQTRLEKFRNQEKDFASLQAAHSRLENIVEEWRSMVRGICDTNVSDAMIPKQVRQCIEKLQHQELSLTSDKVQLESQLKQCQYEAKLAKSELERHTKQVTDLQNIQQKRQALTQRLEKRLKLVTNERDSYRLQLDTYEKDLTINLNMTSGSTSQIQQLAAYRERIDSQEKILAGYREMISNYENDLRKNQPYISGENQAPVRSEQIARMQEEIDRLQNENSRLTERCDELEIRLEQDLIAQDNAKGKVLHFKMNPLAVAIVENETTIEKLQEEVDRLRRKIKNLEDGLETTRMSDSVYSTREVQILREEIESSKIKIQRIKECFKTSSQEFRNACYLLFGYKIDRDSNSQYTLLSMYAESPEDKLQFTFSEGNMSLLENAFSANLGDMLDLHLRHQGSLPVFLSALTMDLYNRTTVSMST